MVGRTVQHYQFLEKLGAGGMGDIFKAHDTRLNRFVAIKVLSGPHASDPERRRRFLQEAQAASALNHPNIITIHDILNDGDNALMVMEYVQGSTLVDLIPKGGLRVPQVLRHTVQMSDALQVAHNAGIVHRDLKPGNIMVTESGLVKILDFGLAKLTDRQPMSQISDATQTIAEAPLTVEGSIIGTVSYMSPEQAQGKKVDTRSDIFSFGVVLYEMATGSRAFAGDSALSTLSAILRDEARPILEIAPDVPPALERVVYRCLRKNPDDRWQSMKEVQGALAALKRESDSGSLYYLRPSPAPIADAPSAFSAPAGPPSPSMPPPSTPPPGIVPPGSQIAAGQSGVAAPGRSASGLSAPVVASIAGGVLFLLVAGFGISRYLKHAQEAAAPPPAPVAQLAPDPEPAPVVAPPAAEQELTNDNVIDMFVAKVSLPLILTEIRTSKTNFNFSSAEIIRMTKAGIPAYVIDFMRDPTKIPVTSAAAAQPTSQNKQQQQKASPQPPPSVAQQAPPPVQTPAPVTPAPVVVAEAPPPPPAPVVAPRVVNPTQKVIVNSGIPFPIELAEDIPNTADEGAPLRFTASRDFRIGDALVIAKGAPVTGVITEGAKKKFIVTTKMTLRLVEATGIDGNKIKIRATSAARSDGPATRPVDTGAKKSKDVAAAAGTEYIAYIDGDQTVAGRK